MWMRLKLIAPFHRPREPRLGGSSSPSPESFFDLAMTALHLDQWGFARHGRATHFLTQRWPPALPRRFDGGPTTCRERAMDGVDDRYVNQTFSARGLRTPIGAHGLCEMHEFGSELVALRELLALLLLADRQFVTQALGVVEGRVADDASLRAHDFVTRAIGGAEAANKVGNALARKLHDDVDGFGHFGETQVAAIRGRGPDLRRLVGEHVSRGVLAVDADVPLRPAAEFTLQPYVAGLHLHRELRVEIASLADPLLAHDVRHLEVASFEVQAVGGHELDAVSIAGFDHAFAVLDRGGQWLFAKHMEPRVRCPECPLGVFSVGRRYVDRLDGAAVEKLVCIGVRAEVIDPVTAAQ